MQGINWYIFIIWLIAYSSGYYSRGWPVWIKTNRAKKYVRRAILVVLMLIGGLFILSEFYPQSSWSPFWLTVVSITEITAMYEFIRAGRKYDATSTSETARDRESLEKIS
jgi:hypothetical protein